MRETLSANRVTRKPWNDPTAHPYMRIVGVTKHFGNFTAVDNISLDLFKGEFFSLLGPSGCGKTTLLRMLAGFETPDAGRIVLDGVDITTVPPYKRPVNMMFQSYALFPHMTVAENIAFGLKQDKVPKPEIAKQVAEMIERVQLEAFLKRKPHQLSGGQRQRVALARSLVKKPKVLLLDEPLSALDKKLRGETQFELINIQEQLGITFLIVTHDQEEAMILSSRIAVMDHGRIVQVGTETEIYEFPNSRYVAEFIGEVNIFKGWITESGADHVRIRSEEAHCEIFSDHGISAQNGAMVWVAIRPEKLTITLRPPADPMVNCLRGEVVDIGYLGNRSIYHVKLGTGKIVTATHTNQTRSIEHAITWEAQVYLTWRADSSVILLN
jgi:spermidine/putrescine ABC transporter ATP-binding subunit